MSSEWTDVGLQWCLGLDPKENIHLSRAVIFWDIHLGTTFGSAQLLAKQMDCTDTQAVGSAQTLRTALYWKSRQA